jgi:NAD+ synthase (glutamine-hydrolysing)
LKKTFRVYNLNDFIYKNDKKNHCEDAKTLCKIELIHDALVMGIRDYFGKMGLKTAILGLSGGIDSAVTLVLAAGRWARTNVHAILLPSRFSSEHSKTDAIELADRTECKDTILLKLMRHYSAFEDLLKPWFKGPSPLILRKKTCRRGPGQ